MRRPRLSASLLAGLAGLIGAAGGAGTAAARAQAPAAVTPPAALAAIYGEARSAFFETVGKLLRSHPLKAQLEAKDLARLTANPKGLPRLFERLITYAYQKDEPLYATLIKEGTPDSLGRLRKRFVALAGETAARFVGSLFRKARAFEFEAALTHNRGKSRLDLVLQSIGFNARNDLPDVPKDKRFANAIEPEYGAQWALEAINARKAWSEGKAKGSGVVVAVIDSGLDPYNSLFKDRTVPGVNLLGRSGPPWGEEPAPMVDWGVHGTACASAVLAVAPECRIMPIRVHDADTMNDPAYDYWIYEFAAAGIYYAVHHGAQVISISAPLPATEPAVREAVRYAYARGVPVCTAAGNVSRAQFGLRLDDQAFRAFGAEVILAGGVEKTEAGPRPWPFTIPHPEIDVGAPAADVFVIVPTYIPDVKDAPVAGTSLAAPIAAGVAALVRGAAPPTPAMLAVPGEYCRLVARSLRESARLDVLGLSEPDDVVGQGLLDAYGAVKRMRELARKAR